MNKKQMKFSQMIDKHLRIPTEEDMDKWLTKIQMKNARGITKRAEQHFHAKKNRI
jgi:hypothetical protein